MPSQLRRINAIEVYGRIDNIEATHILIKWNKFLFGSSPYGICSEIQPCYECYNVYLFASLEQVDIYKYGNET